MTTTDLIDAVTALSLILDEENERLSDPQFAPLPEALVAAKLRHVGAIEAAGLRLSETRDPKAIVADADAASRLGAMIPDMLAKVERNAGLLRRRIALCDDLMGAIAAEARRLTGGRSATYGAHGALFRSEQSTPISVNSSF